MKGIALLPVGRARSIAVLSVNCFRLNSSMGGRAEVLYYTVNDPRVSMFRQCTSFFKHAFHKAEHFWLTTNRSVSIIIIIIIIIIYPLTVRVVEAPQMISQPVFSPFSPVLHCPLGPAELQACPFPDVVFPPLPLSVLSSSPFHCALQDGFG